MINGNNEAYESIKLISKGKHMDQYRKLLHYTVVVYRTLLFLV